MMPASDQLPERVVVGSGVAALVAADALSAAGVAVRLIFGSSVADEELALAGRVLEPYAQLIDLSFQQPCGRPALSSYEPGPRGYRPYVRTLTDYLRNLLGDRLVEVARPQMFFRGDIVDDLYFTTDPRAVQAVTGAAERRAIRAEALAAARGMGDPAGLLATDTVRRLDCMTLANASVVNHGETFHALFTEPLAEKFVPGGSEDVIAALRYRLGLPLFWPKSLARAAGGEDVRFDSERRFFSISGGGLAQLVPLLLKRLADRGVVPQLAGGVVWLRDLPSGLTEIRLANGEVIEADTPVLGLSAAELFAAVGATYAPAPMRRAVAWIEVADADVLLRPSLLNVVDPISPVARVSTGSIGVAGSTVFTIELRHDLSSASLAPVACAELESLGLVRLGAVVRTVLTRVDTDASMPTLANAECFARAARVVESAYLNAEIVGEALEFTADSLGEQIVQGLRAAQSLLH